MTSVTSENDSTSSKSSKHSDSSEVPILPRNTVLRDLTLVSNLNQGSNTLSTIMENPESYSPDFAVNLYRSGLESHTTTCRAAACLRPIDTRVRKMGVPESNALFEAGFLDLVNDSVRFEKDLCLLNDRFASSFLHHFISSSSEEQVFSMRVDENDVKMFHPSSWGFPQQSVAWCSRPRNSFPEYIFGYCLRTYSIPFKTIEMISHGNLPEWLSSCKIRADLSNISKISDTQLSAEKLMAAGLVAERDIFIESASVIGLPEKLYKDATCGIITGINALRLSVFEKSRFLVSQVRYIMFELGLSDKFELYGLGLFVLKYPLPKGWVKVVEKGIWKYTKLGSEKWQSVHPRISDFKYLLECMLRNEGLIQCECKECVVCESRSFLGSEWVDFGDCFHNFRLDISLNRDDGMKRIENEKSRVKSAILIQALFRSAFTRLQLRRKREAIVRIQSFFRQKKAEAICAVLLECLKREKLMMMEQKKNHIIGNGIACITKLQAIYRGKRERAILLDLRAKTVLIQSVWRSLLARKKATLKKTGIIRIQSWIRSVLTRMHLRKKSEQVAKIQARIRGVCVRQALGNLIKSCVLIQSWIRGIKVRKQLKIKYASVILIQSFWRRKMAIFLVLKKLNFLKMELRAKYFAFIHTRLQFISAVTIQRRWRGFVGRRMYAKMRNECEKVEKTGDFFANFFINFWRAHQNFDTPVVYSYWERHVINHWLSCVVDNVSLRKQNCFYRLFQTLNENRKFFVLKKIIFDHLSKFGENLEMNSNLTFQGLDLREAKIILSDMNEMGISTNLLKTDYGKTPLEWIQWLRKSILSNERVVETQIIELQVFAKIIKKDKLIENNLNQIYKHEIQKRAISMISYHYKKFRLKKLKILIIPKCIVIQKNFRGYRFRQKLQKMNMAVSTIQRMIRVHASRLRNTKLVKSTISIQSFFRKVLARISIFRKHIAATRIQAVWRGTLVRLYGLCHGNDIEMKKRENLDRKKRVAKIKWGKINTVKKIPIIIKPITLTSMVLIDSSNIWYEIFLYIHKLKHTHWFEKKPEMKKICIENLNPVSEVEKSALLRLQRRLDSLDTFVPSDVSDGVTWEAPVVIEAAPTGAAALTVVAAAPTVAAPVVAALPAAAPLSDLKACCKLYFILVYLFVQRRKFWRMYTALLGVLNYAIAVFDSLVCREPVYRVSLQTVAVTTGLVRKDRAVPSGGLSSSTFTKGSPKISPLKADTRKVIPSKSVSAKSVLDESKYMSEYMLCNGGDDSLFRDISDHLEYRKSSTLLVWLPIKAAKFGQVRAELLSEKQQKKFLEYESRGAYIQCVSLFPELNVFKGDQFRATQIEKIYHLLIGFLAKDETGDISFLEKISNSLSSMIGMEKHVNAIRGMVFDSFIGWAWRCPLGCRFRVNEWYSECEKSYTFLNHRNRLLKCQIRFACVLSKQGFVSDSITMFRKIANTVGGSNWSLVSQINLAIVSAKNPEGDKFIEGIEKMKLVLK